ncbi:NADH-quinone oxidoreductase subunit A [Desulfosporosinus sp.]|uniref:NADH-quinone oxidoreductase subunit A n=1 Tax=Desulfosporosinus sp. TaxID=157907 RepID=UPI0025C1A60E|nr:NADH-quinone oxidoreductase subunit A [Desulfosporosinus sp.]MBC2721158.1 NADH-quinone oxidoreductase subunit A [Desulfosporosinus sp.]MBC2728246.1 NADH-quinone oxidoreductase subunit A [Desulfosporosinus sp.]
MPDNNFADIGVFLVGAMAVAIIMMIMPKIFAPHKPHKEKLTTYECGNETIGRTWLGFKSNYFLYALVFTVFTVESVFLFPWALTFQKLGTFAFVEMFIFIVILLVGFWYAWKEGALEWM